jgi:hypothetical protein
LARLLGAGHGAAAVAAVIGMLAVGAAGRAFPERSQWLATAAMGAAAAVPAVAAAALAWKGRLRPMVGLIAASMAVVYAGYHGTIRHWDERAPVRDFAVEAGRRVGPGQELWHWGDPQAKTAYYVGRVIPAFQWSFERRYPPQGGEGLTAYRHRIDALCLDWLREDPSRARWIIGYDPNGPGPSAGRRDPAPAGLPSSIRLHPLVALGYEPVLQKQDLQERRHLFTLYERKGPGPSAATRPKPR